MLHLLLLSNVETVEYCSYSLTNATVMSFFADIPHARKLPLREMRIRHWNAEGTSRIDEVPTLLAPTVETLRGSAISWEMEDGGQAWGLKERLPRLRYIDLVEGIVNHAGLADMLSRCPNLQTLRITWGTSIRNPEYTLDFTRMGEALRQYGGVLESLTLNCVDDFSYTQGDSVGRLESLRELTRLRVLRLPQDVLVGDDDPDLDEGEVAPLMLDQVLPTSIEKLCLLSCQDNEDELDMQVVSLIQEGSPFTKLH